MELAKKFDSVGLLTHGEEVLEGVGDVLGNSVNCSLLQSGVQASWGNRIIQAVVSLLRRKWVAGWVIEVVVGQCTFAGLANRGALSCFHSVYRFSHKHYDKQAILWDSVCAELRAFIGLAPLLRSYWWWQWNPMVYSTDASENGYGVTRAFFDRSCVAEMGRVRVISRFRLKDGHSAREKRAWFYAVCW